MEGRGIHRSTEPLIGPSKPLSSRSFEKAAKAYKQTSRSTKYTTALDKKVSLAKIAATKKLGELASQSYKLEQAERKTNLDEPGWKIERKYNNGVKIGNWFQESLTYNKIVEKHATTISRGDYVDFKPRPNPRIRCMASKRASGLPKDFLFKHHGDIYKDMSISGYDQEYSRKSEANWKLGNRIWDQHKLKWVPERTDYPLQGEGTKFGLHEIKAKRDDRDADETQNVPKSTFTTSYPAHERSQHEVIAVPRDLNSKTEPISRLNSNLKLRNVPVNIVPDSYLDIKLLESKLNSATLKLETAAAARKNKN